MSITKDPKKREKYLKHLSEIRKGENNPFFGKTHTKEAREKISKTHKGKPKSEEWKKQTSERMKKFKHSEETKKKLSEIRKGKKASEELKLKFSEMRKGDKHPNWKGGISKFPYCEKFDNDLRERVREFFGRKCVECGKPEGKRKLCVHHVNFDKETCCNNSKPLFVCLCVPCHLKTNWNRLYWEKHFTDIINEQYGGECYLKKDGV